MRVIPWLLALCAVAGLSGAAAAQSANPSPVGRWITIDDDSHKPKSIVRLWEKDKVLFGTIEELFPAPGEAKDPVCDKCEGALKNQRIAGMLFLWGMKRDGDKWKGGRILDPGNGKVYRCTISVAAGGAKLKVRGYVGVSMFGRTQVWDRAPDEPPAVN